MSDKKSTKKQAAASAEQQDHVLSDAERDSLATSLNRHLGASEPTPAAEEKPVEKKVEVSAEAAAAIPVRRHGRLLLFPVGETPSAGDTLSLDDKHFVIESSRLSWRLPAIAFAVLLAIVLSLTILPSHEESGFAVVGLITDSESGAGVAGASVTIPDLKLSVSTDNEGRFRFQGLKPESYLLRVDAPDHQSTFTTVAVHGQPELMLVDVDPLYPDTTATEQPDNQPEQETAPTYGKMKIKSNIEDVEIVLDGKSLGSGNKTFKKIAPGKHVLKLSAPEFEDYVQEISITAGHTADVVAILLPAESQDPVELSAEDYLKLGDSLIAAEAGLEAIGNYTLAIARDPQMPQAYQKRAEANLSLDNRLAALADFRQAGELYSQDGRYDRAISCYDRIINLSPSAVQIYQLRGWAKIWSGGTQAGLLDLEKALSFDDDDWQARFQVGKALCLSGDYKGAEKHLKKIRKYDDEQPQIDAFLALAYLGREKTDDAIKYYKKYAELNQGQSDRQLARLAGWSQLTTLAQQEE